MLCPACKANFTNRSRRAKEVICFHDMLVKTAQTKEKSVTHVYAQVVTNLFALCREGHGLVFLIHRRHAEFVGLMPRHVRRAVTS